MIQEILTLHRVQIKLIPGKKTKRNHLRFLVLSNIHLSVRSYNSFSILFANLITKSIVEGQKLRSSLTELAIVCDKKKYCLNCFRSLNYDGDPVLAVALPPGGQMEKRVMRNAVDGIRSRDQMLGKVLPAGDVRGALKNLFLIG
ncbi:hypothetical protein TNIN_168161 [Trichonephila inaurata madagascariensis]|uniref:Uncharacterized protein n=1 Tax=Trichonephila inaurata madagascariensis TaxID=2747483 RepID=A0A8X6XH90_9ARAC|nr:hypothetical protein TNIN_168161 [Trichonephila inaurata madagascariensis]